MVYCVFIMADWTAWMKLRISNTANSNSIQKFRSIYLNWRCQRIWDSFQRCAMFKTLNDASFFDRIYTSFGFSDPHLIPWTKNPLMHFHIFDVQNFAAQYIYTYGRSDSSKQIIGSTFWDVFNLWLVNIYFVDRYATEMDVVVVCVLILLGLLMGLF